ncbi:MAG: hypothetical protein LUE64_03250 [Candidatus Gastranaerophilales bacterium]|nr:hypothetical protein [Candidatus Gastranaerophilales bacterium]
MTENLAEKYSQKVDERFTAGSLTEALINKDYDWTGVDTVKIYSIDTTSLNDYTKSGTQRYGTPSELTDSVQSLTLTQDKAFTFTIDKLYELSQEGTKSAGAALRRQLDEVVVPEIDIYRISKLIESAGASEVSSTTKSNAYEQFLTAMETLSDSLVPLVGRIALISPSFYKYLKLDDTFIKNSDLGQEITINGQVGKVDGVPIVVVPSSYLSSNVNFIVTHPSALVAPVKLSEYKIHTNPPGVSGSLIEGRIIHDAFVLNNKQASVYVHQTAEAE